MTSSPQNLAEMASISTHDGVTTQISDTLKTVNLQNDDIIHPRNEDDDSTSKLSVKSSKMPADTVEDNKTGNEQVVKLTGHRGDNIVVAEATDEVDTQSADMHYGGGDQMMESEYNDVTVRLIDVPDDDDLFDFMLESQPGKEEELQKTELYKYLTEENNRVDQHEDMTTPYHSGDEHVEEGSEDSSSSSSEETGSNGGEYEEITGKMLPSHSEMGDNLLLQQEEEKSFEQKVRKPCRLANINKPGRKKVSKPNNLTETTLEKLESAKIVTDKWLKDLSIPENLTFSQPLKLPLGDLNPYLTCGLCKGYLYEASTITECMHTFCKNCIVRHCMEVSLHCPVCVILIHPTDPFVNIRLDRMIQDIVYKILPSVAETEMRRIEQFYAEHPEVEPKEIQLHPSKPKQSAKEDGQPERTEELISPSGMVSLVLEAEDHDTNQETLEKKFVRVPSAATVGSVCNFLKKKLSLQDQHRVDLYCCGDAIEESQCTLETIKQNFFGEQEELMLLQYRVRET